MFILQAKISFNSTTHKVHEYQSENAALHDYLVVHPNEEEEAKQAEQAPVLTLEDLPYADQETSDDVDVPETPRDPDAGMRSNTALSSSGGYLKFWQ